MGNFIVLIQIDKSFTHEEAETKLLLLCLLIIICLSIFEHKAEYETVFLYGHHLWLWSGAFFLPFGMKRTEPNGGKRYPGATVLPVLLMLVRVDNILNF